MQPFGLRLKDERRARGWTVPMLSRRSGIPTSTLYSLEDKGSRPREHNLMRLAKAFGLELSEIEAWHQQVAA